jgi:nucleoside-diphosphate-sugar epimerase
MIGEVTGVEVDAQRQPPRPGDVRDSLASLARAKRVLRYTPRVKLREGLEATWRWFRDAQLEAADAPRPTHPATVAEASVDTAGATM